jgi:hypothetical protein
VWLSRGMGGLVGRWLAVEGEGWQSRGMVCLAMGMCG